MSERRTEFFERVSSLVERARPGRFAVNLRPHYVYLHDRERTYFDIYVSLQQGQRLTVSCETVPGHRDTFDALEPHLERIEWRADLPEAFEIRRPGSPGRKGPLLKGVIAVHRQRPDLRTDDGITEAASWSLARVIALHEAIEPYWPTPRVAPKAPRGTFASTTRVGGVRLGIAHAFRPIAQADPVERLVDGEATAEGLRDHEATVEHLDDLVRRAGRTPLYDGVPRTDISWVSGARLVVVEVKSITRQNEIHQVRLGLGQVLDYTAAVEAAGYEVVPVVATSTETSAGRWEAAFGRAGARLVAPSGFADLVADT
ncbi:MAG TPA: hypothetical protein VFU19_01535 [Iamia sp.]|nr:hypothetical protein [Iamia sp.]